MWIDQIRTPKSWQQPHENPRTSTSMPPIRAQRLGELQDAQGCQLKDSCGASCVARGPIGPGGAMGVPSGRGSLHREERIEDIDDSKAQTWPSGFPSKQLRPISSSEVLFLGTFMGEVKSERDAFSTSLPGASIDVCMLFWITSEKRGLTNHCPERREWLYAHFAQTSSPSPRLRRDSIALGLHIPCPRCSWIQRAPPKRDSQIWMISRIHLSVSGRTRCDALPGTHMDSPSGAFCEEGVMPFHVVRSRSMEENTACACACAEACSLPGAMPCTSPCVFLGV